MDYHVKLLAGLEDYLTMGDKAFAETIGNAARESTLSRFNRTVFVSGLLAVSNYCKNRCTYCGLRAPRKNIPRFRLSPEEIRISIDLCVENGLKRIFFVSGEDPGFTVEDMISMVRYAKSRGLHVTLGMGLLPPEILKDLKNAGTDCYTLKFETSNRALFGKFKPTADFDDRMKAIKTIKELDMELGSGNIIGLEGQTINDIASDIRLMNDLAIDWAPIVPYMPAPGTPMAETTPMGSVKLLLRVISIMRLLLPPLLITAGQPAQNSKLGFADPEGNRHALSAGANILFADITPADVRRDFDITGKRVLPTLKGIDGRLAEMGLRRHA